MTTRAASSFHSLHELPKNKKSHVSRAHSSSLVGSPANAPATSLQPNQGADHGQQADSSPLDLRNLRQSILRFDAQVPVDTDPHIRRWWSRAFIASSFVVLFGFVGAIREFETDRMNLQLALGRLIDREDYKRLVWNGEVPDSQRWRWYDDNLVLSGDYVDRGRWHTLFTHVFLHAEVDKLISAMIMFSLFFRAAWVAGFGKIGTPMVVVGSGVAGGLVFLYTKDPRETAAASWGGSSAVTSGLMTAATVARPRMPFFIGFAPAALPIWAVCSLGFLPGLIGWCRDPQKAAQATQEAQARNTMKREQYGQLLADRAAALRKHHEDQRPITETKPDPPRETSQQDENEPTHEEEARSEEKAYSRAASSRREESRDAEPSGEERLPQEERSLRGDDASSKPESPRKEKAGSETGAPRRDSPDREKPTALDEEAPHRQHSPGEEDPPREAMPANDIPPAQRRETGPSREEGPGDEERSALVEESAKQRSVAARGSEAT
ncbi:rhomboid-domain-containing protein [Apiospora sp. TS-2023a]